MRNFWKIIYSFLVLPAILKVAHILSLFSGNISEGLYPRYQSIKSLNHWIERTTLSDKRVLIHAASLGEFEHVKPILQILKERYGTTNLVTFFSPSGYKNVKRMKGLDYYIYMPFDFAFMWHKAYKLFKPDLLIISKHDVWPMQIWKAKDLGIPAFLVNASLTRNSSRTKPFVKSFLKHVYRDFEKIFAISDEDVKQFARHYPRCNVQMMGDTKYDQVLFRQEQTRHRKIIDEKWLRDKWIFLAGSLWPEDEMHLYQAFNKLLVKYDKLAFIIAPHQPIAKYIENMENEFKSWGVKKITDNSRLGNHRILLIDTVGVLADLYKYARAAYVGGSFRQGIHNVMEPAIYGLPILFGPTHKNSFEAMELVKDRGGHVVNRDSDVAELITLFISNEPYRKSEGEKTRDFAMRNTGTTEKLITCWKKFLEQT